MKTCTICNVSKPLSGFPSYRTIRKVLRPKSRCRLCLNFYQTEWYALKGRKTQCPIKARGRDLKRKYGITLEDYAMMLEQQDNNCLICLTPAETPISLYVDHNHDTGEVRGLLCQRCNSALGLLKDDPTVLARASAYLLEKGNYS